MNIRRLAGMGAALSLLLVGGLAAPVLAQSSEDALLARRMEAHVTFLADDALEGRDTGSRGYELAALYVESHFFALGLTPAGNADRTSWRQPVNFAEMNLSARSAELDRAGRCGPQLEPGRWRGPDADAGR